MNKYKNYKINLLRIKVYMRVILMINQICYFLNDKLKILIIIKNIKKYYNKNDKINIYFIF